MTYAEEVVSLCLAQDGDRYVFGAEVSPSDTNPSAFDCSELVQWACARAQVVPTMPDGSWIQARHCRNHGTLISVGEAINTRGALLFRFVGDPFTGGRPSSAHVAISLGNGTSIEARSSRYGVGSFSAYGRNWSHGGLIPGVEYDQQPPVPMPPTQGKVVMQVELETLRLYSGYVSKNQSHLKGDVKILQGCLLAAGLPDPNSDDPRTMCDGLLGPGTEGQLIKFQGSRGLTADGVAGTATWPKLLNQ